ncbi:MAG: ATP-grasp domain-containing protein, partial [Bacteroidota bacterium]
MNLHEYQAKAILRRFSVPVPEGLIAGTAEKAVENAETLKIQTHTEKWAVKAQVHAGGRGKGGGIKIAGSVDEVKKYAREILGMTLVTPQTGPKGKLVSKVLIEQGIYYPGDSPIKEFYVSILLDRKTSHNMIMYSTEGGMDIEDVAHNTPHLIFTEEVDPVSGFRPFQAKKIAFSLGLTGKAFSNMVQFITALYDAYVSIDADLMEINPVIKTSDDLIYAADAKVRIDGNALFRHPEYASMNDITQIDANEVEALKYHLNYIKLDGNVGCM